MIHLYALPQTALVSYGWLILLIPTIDYRASLLPIGFLWNKVLNSQFSVPHRTGDEVGTVEAMKGPFTNVLQELSRKKVSKTRRARVG